MGVIILIETFISLFVLGNLFALLSTWKSFKNIRTICQGGGVAQMVERSLSMREVPGSIPGASRTFLIFMTDFPRTKQNLHRRGIEPGPPAWQASILPLNQRCTVYHCANRTSSPSDQVTLRSSKISAVGRIRTYAPRGNLISSQTP